MNWCALNTKMGGAVDFSEDRKSLQEDVDKLDDWAITNQMKFKKSKCQILHLKWSKFGYMYRLEDERLKISASQKDLGVLADGKLNMNQSRPWHPKATSVF